MKFPYPESVHRRASSMAGNNAQTGMKSIKCYWGGTWSLDNALRALTFKSKGPCSATRNKERHIRLGLLLERDRGSQLLRRRVKKVKENSLLNSLAEVTIITLAHRSD